MSQHGTGDSSFQKDRETYGSFDNVGSLHVESVRRVVVQRCYRPLCLPNLLRLSFRFEPFFSLNL